MSRPCSPLPGETITVVVGGLVAVGFLTVTVRVPVVVMVTVVVVSVSTPPDGLRVLPVMIPLE